MTTTTSFPHVDAITACADCGSRRCIDPNSTPEICKRCGGTFVSTVFSERTNSMGDRLIAMQAPNFHGKPGYMVCAEVHHPGREPYREPKVWFPDAQAALDCLFCTPFRTFSFGEDEGDEGYCSSTGRPLDVDDGR